MSVYERIVNSDPVLSDLLNEEAQRQQRGIELIASENYTSIAVFECLGSSLTNKYSEGMVNARYYGGNEVIDKIESLCQSRALKTFNLDPEEWGVNVQPYSGSPANFAVFTALLNPHDRIMGLHLPDGGHLTHGFMTATRKISATSIFWESMPYKLDPKTELINYDELENLAKSFRPKLIIAGFSCYSRHLDFSRFRNICDNVGAILMVDMAHVAGLIAGGVYPSPFPYAHIVTTTTHKTLRGPRSGVIFYSKALGPNKENFGTKINSAVFPGLQGGPHENVIAAVATCFRQAQTDEFKIYAKQVLDNARYAADYFIKNNYVVATNGTDNHIILLNVFKSLGFDGSKAESLLEFVNISVNKNSCMNDKSVLRPSGIRIGTAAVTTRKFKQAEMKIICDFVIESLNIGKKITQDSEEELNPIKFKEKMITEPYYSELLTLKKKVEEFSLKYPIPLL